mmetsp:Transcript_24199/g.71768  ORF Transcript_24199/g.71768 Transcript_24199/m.71768 type:complete len:269 (+) Transcript_24199:668-1474(+)
MPLQEGLVPLRGATLGEHAPSGKLSPQPQHAALRQRGGSCSRPLVPPAPPRRRSLSTRLHPSLSSAGQMECRRTTSRQHVAHREGTTSPLARMAGAPLTQMARAAPAKRLATAQHPPRHRRRAGGMPPLRHGRRHRHREDALPATWPPRPSQRTRAQQRRTHAASLLSGRRCGRGAMRHPLRRNRLIPSRAIPSRARRRPGSGSRLQAADTVRLISLSNSARARTRGRWCCPMAHRHQWALALAHTRCRRWASTTRPSTRTRRCIRSQ